MHARDAATGRFITRDRATFLDGFVNMMSGAGTTTDPRSHNRYFSRRLNDYEIDAAYRGGWVMRRIIDKPAREMVREWRNWQATPDDISALEKLERRLGIRQQVEKALQLAGLGGAGMILRIRGQDASTPLNPATVRRGDLLGVHVFHRSRLAIGDIVNDPDDERFGEPAYFQLGGSGLQIHPSRVIAFKGHPVPNVASATWNDAYWGDSTVSVVLDAVQNVDASQNGFASLIKDSRNRRLSIPGLTSKVATAEMENRLAARVQALALGENMFGVTFLDGGDADGKGGETLTDRQMVWTGIPAITDMYMTAAAGAADMPATVLWGKSPDGMNSTGESDLQIWERTIKGRQDLDLRPCIDRLDSVLVPSAIGRQADADGVDWDWRPLSVMSEPEAAKAFFDFMQGFEILVNSGMMPAAAIEKLIQNKAAEAAWFPGTEAVLEAMPKDERFPNAPPELDAGGKPVDPSALTVK